MAISKKSVDTNSPTQIYLPKQLFAKKFLDHNFQTRAEAGVFENKNKTQ